MAFDLGEYGATTSLTGTRYSEMDVPMAGSHLPSQLVEYFFSYF